MRGARFIICKVNDENVHAVAMRRGENGTPVHYEVHTIFPGETYLQVTDTISEEPVTIIKKDSNMINIVGEFCEEHTNQKEAWAAMNNLQSVHDVMKS